MASHKHNIKIHEHCTVAPPSATQTSVPLTFFDMFWHRFHPVECIYFYSLHTSQSQPTFFFEKVVPKLKTSLSHTLKHFLPLAGNIVWPSDSKNPIVQYTPGDAVSVLLAISDDGFDYMLSNSPHETEKSRALVPHLESSDSFASVMSLQITLFPNKGFCICLTTNHSVLDGKSALLFTKAWASLCKTNDESPSLVPELEPFFDRTVIKEPTNNIGIIYSNERCLKFLPFPPRLEDTVRGTFVLTREDLKKLKKRVLSKWDVFDGAESPTASSKPTNLSTFIVSCAHTLVCIAKAIQGTQNKQKFAFQFPVDCRARLEPPIPDNYFGNCVWIRLVDTEPLDFTKEEGFVIVAKSIYDKIKMLDKGVFQRGENAMPNYVALANEGVEVIGVAGSNRLGVYGIDFGWGKPSKVEITSVDRGLAFGLTESRDGKGGVEVGLVLNKHVMDLFDALFHGGLCDD